MGFQGPSVDYDPAARAAEQASYNNFQREVESTAVNIPMYFRKKKIYNLVLYTEREMAAAEAGTPQRGVNMRNLIREHVAKWLAKPGEFAEIERVDINIDDDYLTVEYRNRDPIQDSKLITQLFRPDRFAGGSITRVVNLPEPKPQQQAATNSGDGRVLVQAPVPVSPSPPPPVRVSPYSAQATEFDPTPLPEDKKKLLSEGQNPYQK